MLRLVYELEKLFFKKVYLYETFSLQRYMVANDLRLFTDIYR